MTPRNIMLIGAGVFLAAAGCVVLSRAPQPQSSQGHTSTQAQESTQNTISNAPTPDAELLIATEHPDDSSLHTLMLGVISGPQSISGRDDTAQFQAIGVSAVRNNDYYDDRLDIEQIFSCGTSTYPSWSGCDASDDSRYSWTASDAQYQAYIDGGFIPFLRLGGEWENAARHHDTKGPQTPEEENNWITAALAITDRYENWSAKPHAFTYLDIWTEFPGEHFWDRSQKAFLDFFVKAYSAIKAAHPELKVGGPGFSAGVSMQVAQGKDTIASTILEAFYQKGIALDWIGWHMFTTDVASYTQAAQGWQDLLDGTGAYATEPWAGTGFFSHTEVIVDAYGNGGDARSTSVSPTTAKGAAILTSGWIALQQADIQGAFYYRGNEAGDGESGKRTQSEGTGLGLISTHGEKTPSASAFRLWATMTKQTPTLVSSTMSPALDDVYTLTATNAAQTQTTILFANTSDESRVIDLTQAGSASPSQATVAIVDNTHDGTEQEILKSSTVTLVPNSVALVTLTQ